VNTRPPGRALPSEPSKAREAQPTRVPPAPAHRHEYRLLVAAEIDRVRVIVKCQDLEAPEPAVPCGADAMAVVIFRLHRFVACGGVGQSATGALLASDDIIEHWRTKASCSSRDSVSPTDRADRGDARGSLRRDRQRLPPARPRRSTQPPTWPRSVSCLLVSRRRVSDPRSALLQHPHRTGRELFSSCCSSARRAIMMVTRFGGGGSRG
jgi:hypothetical protein